MAGALSLILTLVVSLLVSLLAFARTSSATVVTAGLSAGVNPLSGSRPFRQEMTTFQSSGPAFDLLVQAFRDFQQVDQNDLLSYYQIAGIHGFPIKPWDGVNGSYPGGYCTHDSVVFPPWHRPYIALFEQILWNHAQTIAKQYPAGVQRNEYVAAAFTLRLPYWDWAINPDLPTSCTTPMITVNTPKGNQSIVNPLYTYSFHPLPLGTDFPTDQAMSYYNNTVRSPNSTGQSQDAVTNQVLSSNGALIQQLTYQILSSVQNYTMMSNAKVGSYNSLENIHNGVHTFVGNGGQMAYIQWSSFDPVFWMHHAQVDRIFALWQALNPTSYVEPYPNAIGTFTEAPGYVDSAGSPLTPFHQTSSKFWTAATVRSTRAFGYTYPELVDWGVNASQLQSTVRAKVNNLYNPDISPTTTRGLMRIRSSQGLKHHRLPLVHSAAKVPWPQLLPLVDTATNQTVVKDLAKLGRISSQQSVQMGINNLPMQWAVNFQVDKFILSGPFSIHVFLTAPPEDPSQWATCDQHIGSGTIFTMSNTTAMPSIIISGQAPLTHALYQAVCDGILPNLDPVNVIPLLISSLNWRIQKTDGSPVDTKDLVNGKGEGGLKISVSSRKVTPRTHADEFPVYGKWTSWPSATADKVGGELASEQVVYRA